MDTIMELKEMYDEYFREEERYLPYADEKAHREALFCYLRIRLLAGYALKQEVVSPEEAKRYADGAGFHIRTRLHITGEAAASFPFEQLCYRFFPEEDWSRFLLLFTWASAEDTVLASLVQEARGELKSAYNEAYLLYSVFDKLPEGEYAAGIEKKLSIFRYLIDTSDASGAGFTMRLSPKVLSFLNGSSTAVHEAQPGSELEGYATPEKPAGYELPIREDRLKELSGLIRRMTGKPGTVLQLFGPEGIGKRDMLKAATNGRPLLFIDMKKVSAATVQEMRELLRRIRRECALSESIPAFYGFEPVRVYEGEDIKLPTVNAAMTFLYRELAREYPISVWITEEKADYLLKEGLHVLFFELPMLRAAERKILWEYETKNIHLAEDVDLTACANQYILTPRSMREVVWDASVRAKDRPVTKEDIREAVAGQVVNQLGTLATHIRSVYTWDDLVIDEKERRHLQMICDQVRYRGIVGEEWGFYKKTAYGRGICAMFYGQPGTGKTMAAQVIANELGLELYRIDLSQMVSKYIGETQKNVTKLFERARNTNAILFFDEADSLFSKRSEVKDFHDKNANAETAHLLQKLEDYEGITILATNYAQNIDDAFKRRIRFMVNFVFPEAPVRRRLWHTILPDGVPAEEKLDLDFFADNFELSGSSIKEVLTAAAFIAASEGRGLRNEDVVEAVKMNFEKHGKVLNDADFGYLKG